MTYNEYMKQAIIETIRTMEDENLIRKLYAMVMNAVNQEESTLIDNAG